MPARLQEYARQWDVIVDEEVETGTSFIAFGTRGGAGVVLKVSKARDEWHSGQILAAFGGHGTVRVYEHTGGAVLLERVEPGTSLSEIVFSGREGEAVDILAHVIREMTRAPLPESDAPSVEEWGVSFERYLQSDDQQIPRGLVTSAQSLYADLCASQKQPRLLHGDLHHYNVLLDARRGWLAIDPKGVVGELEYEIGAALRNPYDRPELFTSPEIIQERVARFAPALNVDPTRVRAWGFSQAVLSAVWSVEDGEAVTPEDARLLLASALRPILP